MTKVSVLGQANEEKKELKKIEFIRVMMNDLDFIEALSKPTDYEDVILISKDMSRSGYDLILGRNASGDMLYLGHWNDGVV